ncbi:biotin transporter BioY [Afipia sp. Root123D2]|uniref:molybdopterin guanine dinucleotide-containing S/N-oxide reductase n=1 Tax=Afipia sp. Root123D2 TaxID=1736436 RepID=UPI00070138BA|nr:molybdopterin guanine dinucleotide-containing S/N-oxide reductase [Afipia sp. Root123D2]KQW20911.1 biotin transporter BioY [Afipia sp. Root123D2]
MTKPASQSSRSHLSHYGAFSGQWIDDELVITPHPSDPHPNRVIQNFAGALRHKARVARPMIRRGWLENGPGRDERRGRDEFVEVEWDHALDFIAAELKRVGDAHGPQAIYGGSYGWSSAGRFHHAQSQVHRFLNFAMDGYVRSVNTYSSGAASVILPYVIGGYEEVSRENVLWEDIVAHTDIVLAFGGMALKNSFVAPGGVGRHSERDHMRACHARGGRFVLISPIRDDLPPEINAEWLTAHPGTDTALMLGIAHTLVVNGWHDRAFLASHCVGWPQFEDYLMGRSDGVPKDAAWASKISGITADEIARQASRLPGKRVLIVVSHSLQRAEHGEQPVWMAAVLAAMLGQFGLPGGGFNYALGAMANFGRRANAAPIASLPQGANPIKEVFIPVARIADMLLNPGAPFDYNGRKMSYPDIRLVYWAGGNPFHHHQDINRLRKAVAQVETFIVHEIGWTATARHADIVLPATMTLERNDIGGNPYDPLLIAMQKMAEPYGEARDDYDIFTELADRLGRREAFTEGRTSDEWLRHLYKRTQNTLVSLGLEAPDFEAFWERGELLLPQRPHEGGLLRAFRNDPQGNPLTTPSGKIEIFSERIASYGYADCPGHPAWISPVDVVSERHPLQLVANQPASRLHSQFDFGGHSAEMKHRSREVMCINPQDASARGIADGDIVKLFNDRGACLAAARLTDGVRPGVVQLPTGAWYDPEDPDEDKPLCVHGNPNVLTRDIGTSSLAQGCCGQLTTVQVERFTGNLPAIQAFEPPPALSLSTVRRPENA